MSKSRTRLEQNQDLTAITTYRSRFIPEVYYDWSKSLKNTEDKDSVGGAFQFPSN